MKYQETDGNSQLNRNLEALYRSIGKAQYLYLTEEQETIVAFGMVPVEVIEPWEKHLEEQYRKSVAEHYGESAVEFIKKDAMRNFISVAMKGFTLGLFDAARENKKMVA